jgi:hypothetical protein
MSERLEKAYCEGRHAAYKGAAANTNPFDDEWGEYAQWAAGWASYGAEAVSNRKDACADLKGGGFSLTVDATLTLDSATDTITATVTQNSVVAEGVALTAESSDEAICTVAGDGDTDASGEVTFTVTRVANGTATVTISTTLGTTAECAVTASGVA